MTFRPDLNSLVDGPIFALDVVTHGADEVDQQLALDGVVDHHGSVGYVEHHKPQQSHHHKYHPDCKVRAEEEGGRKREEKSERYMYMYMCRERKTV